MNRRLFFGICLILFFNLSVKITLGQERQNINQFIDSVLKDASKLLPSDLVVSRDSLAKAFSGIVANILENTETLNKVWDTYVIEKAKISFLRDVNLKFKTFHVNGQDNSAGLGFSYSYSKDIMKHMYSQKSVSNSGISFAIKAEGNVAFDRRINPRDFLDSKLSFHFFHSHGGVVPERSDAAMATIYNEWEDELTLIDDQAALDNSPIWIKFFSSVSERLTTQFYIDFALNGSLESNQDFSQKQYVYGAQVGLDLKAWNRNSTLANLNIFDWPFAVIRVLTGYDKDLSPRGSTIPTILVGLDGINPVDDSLRVMVEDDSVYPRFRTEVSFKTPISRSAYFVANLRYYKELGASPSVKSANVDKFLYFTSAVTLSNGLFVSYTTGKLPFDAENDQVYEIGFQYKFN